MAAASKKHFNEKFIAAHSLIFHLNIHDEMHEKDVHIQAGMGDGEAFVATLLDVFE